MILFVLPVANGILENVRKQAGNDKILMKVEDSSIPISVPSMLLSSSEALIHLSEHRNIKRDCGLNVKVEKKKKKGKRIGKKAEAIGHCYEHLGKSAIFCSTSKYPRQCFRKWIRRLKIDLQTRTSICVPFHFKTFLPRPLYERGRSFWKKLK